jgi:hypothetical protein
MKKKKVKSWTKVINDYVQRQRAYRQQQNTSQRNQPKGKPDEQ